MDTKIKEDERKKRKTNPRVCSSDSPCSRPAKTGEQSFITPSKIRNEQHFACELIREASRSGAVDTLMKWNLNY